MPTTRRRRGQPRRSTMERLRTADHFMCTGRDLFSVFRDDTESMTNYWQAHGSTIVAEHAVKCPGTRPWGWWVWECPDVPRKIINPAPDEVERHWRSSRTFRGAFIPFSNILHGHGPKDEFVPWLESEESYLERTGFLSVEELGALDNLNENDDDGSISDPDIEPIEDDHLAGDDELGPPTTDDVTDQHPFE
jgi:hypothetical protein